MNVTHKKSLKMTHCKSLFLRVHTEMSRLKSQWFSVWCVSVSKILCSCYCCTMTCKFTLKSNSCVHEFCFGIFIISHGVREGSRTPNVSSLLLVLHYTPSVLFLWLHCCNFFLLPNTINKAALFLLSGEGTVPHLHTSNCSTYTAVCRSAVC